ncbi:MAG: peptidase, partial [Alphaproteobacteria bacterium]|nr:peptidase [Alphaproteobacteria bacterium]
LLEAAAGRTLHVMFPMIAEPWEFEEARALFEAQLAIIKSNGKMQPKQISYGSMLEVPALAECLDMLLPKIDFLSIGTNDLTQFLFAADRSNPKLAERYDWLSTSILRYLKRIVDQCDIHKVPVTVCGEMGGRPLEAMALLGLGVERLSITPAAIGPVKAMVRTLPLGPLREEMNGILGCCQRSTRAELSDWALQHAVEIA